MMCNVAYVFFNGHSVLNCVEFDIMCCSFDYNFLAKIKTKHQYVLNKNFTNSGVFKTKIKAEFT